MTRRHLLLALLLVLVAALTVIVSSYRPWGWALPIQAETGCKGVTTLDLQPARRAALIV